MSASCTAPQFLLSGIMHLSTISCCQWPVHCTGCLVERDVSVVLIWSMTTVRSTRTSMTQSPPLPLPLLSLQLLLRVQVSVQQAQTWTVPVQASLPQWQHHSLISTRFLVCLLVTPVARGFTKVYMAREALLAIYILWFYYTSCGAIYSRNITLLCLLASYHNSINLMIFHCNC